MATSLFVSVMNRSINLAFATEYSIQVLACCCGCY